VTSRHISCPASYHQLQTGTLAATAAFAADGSAALLQRCLVKPPPKAVLQGKKAPECEQLLPWHALMHEDPTVLQMVGAQQE
jgi:hypothetical protein